MNVGNTRFRITFLDEVRTCVHQMRLAQTNTTVEEQRVVSATWVFSHLKRRCLRKLVALTFDERAECEISLEARTDDETIGASSACRWNRRHWGSVASRRRHTRSDLYGDDRNITVTLVTQQLTDTWQQIGVHPINHESIRSKQLQRAGALQNLQRPHPRIELLLWKLGFQGADALS